MMNHIDYYLRAANILLMNKHLQLPFAETICYLQFVKNTIGTDSAQNMIQGDMRKFNPKAEHNWIPYGKLSWEGYSKKKFKKRNEEFEAKDLHVECEKGKGEDLIEILWWWQKSGLAAKRFREHICIVEFLKPDTSPGQTERTIHVNFTGRRFQCRVGMISLVDLVDTKRLMKVRASPTDRTKRLRNQLVNLSYVSTLKITKIYSSQ